jgi:ABC-type Na+ transport system ATPase subunit NatA
MILIFSFGTLIDAQALGDRQALLDKGRKVLRIEFESTTAVKRLAESI